MCFCCSDAERTTGDDGLNFNNDLFFLKKTVVIMRELRFVQVIPERRLRDPLSVAIPGGERGSHGLAPVGVAQHGADHGALGGKKR